MSKEKKATKQLEKLINRLNVHDGIAILSALYYVSEISGEQKKAFCMEFGNMTFENIQSLFEL